MNSLVFNTRFLIVKALLFSVLVHWAIFNNVTLIFSPLLIPPKPSFVFLGSLLQASDMASDMPPAQSDPQQLHHLDKLHNQVNLFNSAVEKPNPSLNPSTHTKRTLKSVEMPEVPATTIATPIGVEDREIKKNVEPYKPLRYKDYDQN